MKKYLVFLGLFLLPASGNAVESVPSPFIFNDSSSFQIARAYKLGLMEDSGMNPSGKDYEGKTGLCSKDSDCSEGQACKGNACTDVCSPNPCAGGYKCIASGHSYTCAQCTADSDCASNKKCSNNTCIDACSGNNCASQSKKCTTNNAHGYTCYGCTSDAACPNDQRCDTRTSACVSICPSACPGQHCTVSGAHKATCSGCTSDEGCPSGQKCDVEANACVATCTPQKCADENGGTAEDWYIKETSTGCECATDKKYVILADVHPNMKYSADKYMRIKAVKDFGNIKKGTLGGYVQNENNLSQTGNAWVGCDNVNDTKTCALVGGNAKVYDNALVSGGGSTDYGGKEDGYGGRTRVMNEAQVYGNAKVLNGSSIYAGKVYGSATFHGAEVYSGAPTKPAYPGYYASEMTIAGEVFGNAHIYAGGYIGGSGSAGPNNNPKVYGNAILAGGDGDKVCMARVTYLGQVYENAKVFRCGEVSGNAKVHGSAIVENSLFGVQGDAEVYGNARVGNKGVVTGKAKMYGDAVFMPDSTGTSGVPYLCGNAVLSGTAKITSKTGSKNTVCKNSYSKGEIGWQESYCSSKNCPQ